MLEVLKFLEHHGYAVIFIAVLIEQLGAPLPAAPVLLAAGALAGAGKFALAPEIALATLAAMIADAVWYGFGRQRGQSILKLLCRISLEPDSCVSDTKTWFKRLGAWSLLIAKFVPGLSTVAPPMAGMTRMPLWRFFAADLSGGLVWSGTFAGLGFVFSRQIEEVAEIAGHMGIWLGAVLGGLLAAYILLKYWQRQRFLKKLRTARITPEQLLDRMMAGEDLLIIDLRHSLEIQSSSIGVKGARWYERKELAEHHHKIPRDREVILYCS